MENNFSNTRFNSIIQNAAEGIITINQCGDILTMNTAAEEIFGYGIKEVFSKNIQVLLPESSFSDHLSKYRANKPAMIGSACEVIGKRNNGQEFPIRLSVAEFHEDGEKIFASFISDLSIEKGNLKKTQNLERILEHSLNEIYIFDVDTLKFMHANQGALLNVQYSLSDMKNKTPVDIKPDFTYEKFHKIIAPLKNGDIDKVSIITRHQRKDGSTYPVEVHIELSEYENKKVFIAIILDITKRIAAQNELRLNEEKLAHMDRISIFGEMAAGIAHEINQPLTAIGAYASAGLRRIDSENVDITKLKDLLDKICAANQRANDVVTRLKFMLKPKSRMTDNLNINKIIGESIDLIKIDSRSVNFDYILNLPNNLPKVVGDSAQLKQVIMNLIRNSMDAAIDSGVAKNQIIINSEAIHDGNQVQVSIKDFGCGINPEMEDKLFEPFQTTKQSGMGIGLSICQTIIQSHRGRIWMTKNNDRGVTFHFTVQTAKESNYV